ncbi:SDR family NAD(P)-dependent oxidoreductase [Saccharothrix variisporea]|uniref:Short-subunit dehydrogenase n=1 Tax=Saccharothrix variisporea TaxID=543527 RepID=A0A495XK47_9PSEU|nr:SDR family NAD(P)-dependent oxidoreductase [Saccharothrix variisporea]RKT73555.1 short-subunit dehydrogenase [Saccharothrix variisporea]
MSTVVVLGVGPGLGLSIAHRFGREGRKVALVSRSAERHPGYVAGLRAAGVEAEAFVADVRDREQLLSTVDAVAERLGPVEVVYYGPADLGSRPQPITETTSADVTEAMSWVLPAVDVVGHVLPGMVERGGGGLLFAGGLSAVVPMPPLGAFALSSAALRNYALTLNAALAGQGVYAGSLTIGGLIERGDIHQALDGRIDGVGTLDPDDLADTAWDLYAQRDRGEAVFNALS